VHHEKCDRHFTGGDERGESRQQANANENSANDFTSRRPPLMPEALRLSAECAEYLIEAVTGKHQPDDESMMQ